MGKGSSLTERKGSLSLQKRKIKMGKREKNIIEYSSHGLLNSYLMVEVKMLMSSDVMLNVRRKNTYIQLYFKSGKGRGTYVAVTW